MLGQTVRNDVFFGTSFVRQTEGILEPALELDYTVFDWNARLDAVRAARYDLFSDDFAFNQYHLLVIDAVTRSYFQLLNSQGQVAAATVNLQNASTVASEVDARLEQGLATLPDVLEARPPPPRRRTRWPASRERNPTRKPSSRPRFVYRPAPRYR